MMLCHGMISNISSDRLCMVGISLTIGIEEQMQLISKCSSSLNFYFLTSLYFITFSDLLIQQNLIMKDTENTLNRNCLLKCHKCLVWIQMQKSVTWQLNVKLSLILFWQFKEEKVEEVVLQMMVLWTWLWIWKIGHHNNTQWLILQAELKKKHHTLSSVYKNVREWILFFKKSRRHLKILDLV